MSALDLVEEFRSLDEVEDTDKVEDSAIGKLSGVHNSIGGADLSGILALDDDDNNDDFDAIAAAAAAAGKDAASTTAATAPLRASALSFAEDDVAAAAAQKLGGRDGDQLALEAGEESEAWDSEEDEGQGIGWPGRAPDSSHGGALVGGAGGTGRLNAICGGSGVHEESRMTPSSSAESSPAGGLEGGLSSPKRPAEESSDWDGEEAGQSSDDGDDDSDPRRKLVASDCREELPWSKVNAERKDGDSSPSRELSPSPCARPPDSEPGGGGRRSTASASGDEEGAAVIAGGTITHEQHHRKGLVSSCPSPSTQSDDQVEEPIGVARGDSTPRRTRAHDRPGLGTENEGGTQVTFQEDGTGAEAGEGDAATIRALRAELSTLREHVLRSEQKREAQLRELGTRLAVQERRSGPERSGSATSAALGEEGERETVAAIGTPALVVGEAVETGRDKGGCRDTPRGAVVRNPFAGAGGGAATTPRDHFPAFEDALLDRGESEATPGGSGDEEGGGRGQRGEEGSKSALHNEAFDFSIDTLSHINNHTDFGTDAPLTPALRSATATTSPKISRGAAGQARLPWAAGGGASSAQDAASGGRSKRLVREEEEEEDAAVEEAFFSDACATASLKTPVKHMLATAASDLGVAVRRGRRPDTGKAAPSSSAAAAAAATAAPTRRMPPAPSCCKGEQQQERSSSRRRSGAGGRPPRGRESPLPPDPHSPELCMADVFARASAELDRDDGGVEEDRSCLPIECGAVVSASAATVADPPKGERGSVGVDAGCQTSWSFSARDEIRFVSIPSKPPLTTRMADGRSCRRGAEEGVAAAGPAGLASRPAGKQERAAPGGAGCIPGDGIQSRRTLLPTVRSTPPSVPVPVPVADPGPCCTPRQSRLPLCHTPSRRPRRKSDEDLVEGAGPKSENSSFFDSPNLSPIPAVARAGPPHSVSQNADVPCGGWRGGGGDNGGGGEPRVMSARRRQQQQQGRGLPTILSEGEGSASPGGEKTRQGFGRQAPDGPVAERRTSSTIGGVGAGDRARGSESSSSRRESPFLAAGVLPVPRAGTAVDRSSGSGPLFMDSFADVTRSSVLRASSTLNTIAPLDDTGPPLSYSSRIGVSFAGELFADSRLRASSGAYRAPRYDACAPPQTGGDQIRAGGSCCALPLPHMQQQVSSQRQRRSWSAPTLFSEWSKKHGAEADRVVGPGAPQKENSPGLGGVPPDVVGAWLALAIEGIYSHNDSGGSVTDGRVGESGGSQGRRDCSLGRDPGPAARPSNGGGQAVPARAGQAGGVFASGPEDSPPPPPPPPEALVLNDEDGDANEEEIFYQRQRLLQRVVSAAASHGGVMPPLLSSVRGQDHREHGEQDVVPGRESWRRHSDPLSSREVPAAGSGAAEATEASAAAGTASGWPDGSSSTSAGYMRRHTSSYWRDRLGMTH